jgi:hypothetical protein
MSLPLKKVVRLLAVAAAIATISLASVNSPSKSGAFACGVNATGGATPLTPCPNTACVSACWDDGTYYSPGHEAVEKQFAPVECGIGHHGCITRTCH